MKTLCNHWSQEENRITEKKTESQALETELKLFFLPIIFLLQPISIRKYFYLIIHILLHSTNYSSSTVDISSLKKSWKNKTTLF